MPKIRLQRIQGLLMSLTQHKDHTLTSQKIS